MKILTIARIVVVCLLLFCIGMAIYAFNVPVEQDWRIVPALIGTVIILIIPLGACVYLFFIICGAIVWFIEWLITGKSEIF
jgi:hypothetical protein